ncbi:hypothetical protein ACEWY4_000386 [Coilia grayii]|uniref:Gypsy retrotransposon integrase-like protein 1 n=2 Tax=Coilia grayii TaxID=363190 RepID=A0ABD1KXR2_9TELE
MATRKKVAEDKEAGAVGGATEREMPIPQPAAGDTAIDRLATMFQSFIEIQRVRDEQMEREASQQTQQVKVLTHQMTQLQLDMESSRATPMPSRGASPEPPLVATEGRPPKMAKLEEADNIEHYLTTFERLAIAFGWRRATWAVHLIPLLTGKARSAFVAMNPEDATDYDRLKEAVLKKYEINAETYRQQFRALETSSTETPQELYVRLKDLFCKWTGYEKSSKENLMETLVLEQYLRVLYPDVRTWVRERNPKTAAEAAMLVESYVAAHRGPRGYRYAGVLEQSTRGKSVGFGKGVGSGTANSHSHSRAPPPPPTDRVRPQSVSCYNCGQEGHKSPACPLRKSKYSHLCYVPHPTPSSNTLKSRDPVTNIELNGKSVQALLDTGCSQTLVQADLVPLEFRNCTDKLTILCVHGDKSEHDTADVYVRAQGQTYLLRVGLVSKLPYPVLLGQDLPVLTELVTKTAWCGVVTRAQAREQQAALTELPYFGEDVPVDPTLSRQERCDGRRQMIENTVKQNEMQVENIDPPELTDCEFNGNLAEEQRADPTLKQSFKKAEDGVGYVPVLGKEGYILQNELLYRQSEEGMQLVIPKKYRKQILEIGHSIPWAGHLAYMKTLQRIGKRFYWPGLFSDVKEFCKSCPQCQLSGGKNLARAPMIPLPVIDTPFDRIAVDVVGPLEKSKSGNRFILVICDYATRYPEAFPLRDVTAKRVATAMLQLFSRVGIPREVLTDQGPNFMSKTLRQVYDLLGIRRIRTTPYHPQTDGLVERFNQTLLNMLRKFVEESGKDWDQWLPYLLFAYREVPQASTGFSPFELLYAHQVRGPLDVLKETWEGETSDGTNIISYVLKMREKLASASALAQENLQRAQERQKTWYDRSARTHCFQAGDKVLLLLPSSDNKLLAKWQGPYAVTRQMGRVTYEVHMPDHRKKHQVYHVNMLKKWTERQEQQPEVSALLIRAIEEEEECREQYLPCWGEGATLDLSHLSEDHQRELTAILPEGLFVEQPGRTEMVEHRITLKDQQPVRQPCYRVPESLLAVLKDELDMMLELGVIEPSSSEWNSPIILVPKKDGHLRFCLDCRKVNAQSKFDPYPMPRVDDLVERLGKAKFLTTIDLCKGYWQVPLAEDSKELTAFRTPFGHYQFTVLPFGLHGAPATFQRLMDRLLRGTEGFAAAYLDDICVYSSTWEDHLQHLQHVLSLVKEAGLTIHPEKCTLAKEETAYLGYMLGRGVIRPQVGKVEAIKACERPTTKKQVRSFLGLVGWYRRFISNFSERAVPLTELTRKSQPNKVAWTEECEAAFQGLKDSLCREPVLLSPDFNKTFTVQTDASERGLGAVLLQEDDGHLRPVAYISRKLLPRECNYSTVEKECLAIKWALDSFKYYLLGRKFVLETDHRALSWLGRMRDTNSRITRWFLAVQPFDFEVLYRSGKLNITADFLSRVPQGASSEGGGNVTD